MTVPPIEVREFRVGDQAKVERLWQSAGVVPQGSDAATVIDTYVRARAHHATILVAAVSNGADKSQIAATVIAVDENGREGTLHCVATCREYRRRGIGRATVQAAERLLQSRGVLNIKLRVDEDNAPARAFYRNLGFKEANSCYLTKTLTTVSCDNNRLSSAVGN